MPSHWHCVPAGNMSSTEPRSVLEQELQEELDCDWSMARSVKVLAVLDTGDEQGNKPEIVCWLHLALSAADVLARYQKAEDRAEHDGLMFVNARSSEAGAAENGLDPAPSFPTVSLDDFLRDFLLTDVSRRALHMFRLMRGGGSI
mmetsp:Transcript_46236/g.128858  ORF Transcript_46236/g.128858 Transcript_46236/m.128858 type:complete len:145 (+) Transcript_46236:37-471(+)